ncbi:ABC transporter permease subunit [Brevibacillus sp. SYSU BS000544]|uniref:ABC transporter permease subunit n=1 Tax=Brevibacillus sp. SYSU BS000544 TaxID=3416443 RepID=UPI003CE464F5
MISLYLLTRNEWQKLTSRKSNLAFLVLLFALPVLVSFLLGDIQERFGFLAADASNFPLFMLNLSTVLVIPIFICKAAADLFADEWQRGGMKFSLAFPISRWRVYVSKLAAIGVFVCGLIVALYIGSVLGGFTYMASGSWAAFFQGLIAYMSSWFSLMTLAVFFTYLNQFLKSSNTSMTLSILLYLGMQITALLEPSIAPVLPVTYLDWYEPLLDTPLSLRNVTNILYLLSFSGFFFLLGYDRFNKREL